MTTRKRAKGEGSPAYYRWAWETLEILPEWRRQTTDAARRVIRGKARYQAVEGETGIPWYWIALTHELEARCDFDKQILNGQGWNRRTTLVPVGKGPFKSWHESAVKGSKRFGKRKVWDIAAISKRLEMHNGGGYMRRGKHSPYLYSAGNHGIGQGKYVSDGKYKAGAVSMQVGAMCILKRLEQMGEFSTGLSAAAKIVTPTSKAIKEAERLGIDLDALAPGKPLVYYCANRPTDKKLILPYKEYQRSVNRLHADLSDGFIVKVDGWPGPDTSAAHRIVFGHYLAGDPRNV